MLAVWAEQVCVLPKAATSQPRRVFVPPALFVLPLREGFEADRNHPRFFPGKPIRTPLLCRTDELKWISNPPLSSACSHVGTLVGMLPCGIF